MRLIDEAEATRLYAAMGPAREASGGSAANTVAGLAALGHRAAFIGQLGEDQLGEIFAHDIRGLGVAFDTPARSGIGATGRCLILVTPDAQRTMNTHLGAAQMLGPDAVDEALIADSKILYLEGYLWDPEAPRLAMRKAIAAARSAGTRVAFTLSDSFVVDRHRDDLNALFDEGAIDILFANEAEAKALTGAGDLHSAIAAIAARVPTAVVTQHEHGAVAVDGEKRASVPAAPNRAAGRHHRRRRSVRCGLPCRRGARARARNLAQARRDRRRRSHPALWRPARSGPQGAGRRAAGLNKKKGRPKPPLPFDGTRFIRARGAGARRRSRGCRD